MLTIYKILILVSALGAGVTLKHFWPNYQDDNPVEEFVEQVIHAQTGVDVDITPFSPEKNEQKK